ncbi:MAG: hypothetical protein SOX97_04025 [Sutterella sp.]|nr:hypothetical protein [Sutterella sp.]
MAHAAASARRPGFFSSDASGSGVSCLLFFFDSLAISVAVNPRDASRSHFDILGEAQKGRAALLCETLSARRVRELPPPLSLAEVARTTILFIAFCAFVSHKR